MWPLSCKENVISGWPCTQLNPVNVERRGEWTEGQPVVSRGYQDPFPRRTQNPKSRQREPKELDKSSEHLLLPPPGLVSSEKHWVASDTVATGGLFLGVHNGQQTCFPPRFVEDLLLWHILGFLAHVMNFSWSSSAYGDLIFRKIKHMRSDTWFDNGTEQDFSRLWTVLEKLVLMVTLPMLIYYVTPINSPLRGLWESFLSQWHGYPHNSTLLLGKPRLCKNTWHESMKEIIVA